VPEPAFGEAGLVTPEAAGEASGATEVGSLEDPPVVQPASPSSSNILAQNSRSFVMQSPW
jgi:hypothetical protein